MPRFIWPIGLQDSNPLWNFMSDRDFLMIDIIEQHPHGIEVQDFINQFQQQHGKILRWPRDFEFLIYNGAMAQDIARDKEQLYWTYFAKR